MRRDRRVRKHNVARGEARTELLRNLEKRVIVGHENLHEIAHLGQLRWRADKIRHGSRSPVPDEYVEPFPTKNLPNTASDYSEADQPNIFLRSMGHVRAVAGKAI
jgi:hypothetical protein